MNLLGAILLAIVTLWAVFATWQRHVWRSAAIERRIDAQIEKDRLVSEKLTLAWDVQKWKKEFESMDKLSDALIEEKHELAKQLDAANEELAFDSRVQSLQEQLSVVITERDQLRLQVEANDEFDGRDFAARHDSIGVVDRTFEDHERG